MVRVRNALGKAKKEMLKAGRPIFRKALPIVAALMASCSPGNRNEEQCDHYNESTVIINESGSDDRQVAGVETLREEGSFISEELAHAVRATHALSTDGLPRGFQTAFTVLDEECFINPETGLTGSAYAIPPEHDWQGDLGVYTHTGELTLDDFSLITHEIGHLQMPCGEICAEINSAEQMLMLFVAYSNQSDSEGDLVQWAAQATNQIYGLEALHDALRHMHDGNFRLDPDPLVSMSMHPKWKYIRADVYILESLIRHAGNFSEIREEVMGVQRNHLQAEADESLERFVERYSESGLQTALADIIAEIRMAHYSELNRRFGAEAANDYFNSNTFAAFWFPGPREIVRVDGLGGMNCIVAENAESVSEGSCSGECAGFGVVNAVNIVDVRLGCFSVDNSNPPTFNTWEVTASGIRYRGIGGRRISIDNVNYNGVVVFDTVNRLER